jgi:SMODS and SLOG-associating 2TM effector domain 1
MPTPPAPASQLPLFHVVGFSGHRQLADPASVMRGITTILGELRRDAPGEWIALSSAAAGADLLFIRTILDLKLGWEALLPLPLLDFERDFPPDEWLEVKALLARAEHLEIAAEPGSREEAYLSGGFEIVNRCDVLLVVWDGQPARGKGGTADVVAYARAMGRPIVIFNPVTQVTRRENFERLRLQDANLKYLNSVPGPAEAAAASSQALVTAFQKKVDDAATQSSPHFRRLIAITVWLHVGATGLATASLAFGWHWGGLPWGKLLLLLLAFGVATVVRFQRTHHNWTRCRLAAEITRSALAIWGLPRATRLFADFDWSGLEPLRRSLDVLHRRAARETGADFDTFRQQYLTGRIDDQLAYFARQEARANPLLSRLRFGFVVTSMGAILFTALYALHRTSGWPVLPHLVEEGFFYFAPIMLPVMAAAFISLISINDLHRRVARYREMCIRLETVRKEIAHSQTWAGLERAIAKAERVLLQEVFEWHSITSFTESH